MSDENKRSVLAHLLQFADLALTVAAAIDPRLAAREARFGERVFDALMLLRTLPVGAPITLLAQNLWLGADRCRTLLLTYDANSHSDVRELRDALEDVQLLAANARIVLETDPE